MPDHRQFTNYDGTSYELGTQQKKTCDRGWCCFSRKKKAAENPGHYCCMNSTDFEDSDCHLRTNHIKHSPQVHGDVSTQITPLMQVHPLARTKCRDGFPGTDEHDAELTPSVGWSSQLIPLKQSKRERWWWGCTASGVYVPCTYLVQHRVIVVVLHLSSAN